MICGTFTLTEVPDDQVDAVVDGFKATQPRPTDTTKTQTGGTWTVVATYPPCPANTTHSPGTAEDT